MTILLSNICAEGKSEQARVDPSEEGRKAFILSCFKPLTLIASQVFVILF